MLSQDTVYDFARKGQKSGIVVGIGCPGNDTIIKKSAGKAIASGFADDVIIYKNARCLISALKRNRVDCVVRGTLGAASAVSGLLEAFGLEHLSRAAVMAYPNKGRKELLMIAPVGITEGNTINQKVELAVLSAKYLGLFGSVPEIGIMAMGRQEDGRRGHAISKSLSHGRRVTDLLIKKGLNAKFYGIEIEKAICSRGSSPGTVNCIIAPDGVSGNIVFRALHYLGGWDSMGAPVLNLVYQKGAVFIDTSRGKADYSGSIALAAATRKLLSASGKM
jgi:predicted methyltransferase MtxX (methanogen marker protein 4)